jgi:hypothetical protein
MSPPRKLEKGMMTTKATKVIDYIVQRIADEGVEHCFGVPGDYAFPVGDAVDSNPNIKWIGCSNELNASYADRTGTKVLACGGISSALSGKARPIALRDLIASRLRRLFRLLPFLMGED